MLFPTLDFLFFFIVVLALMVPVARAPQARKLVLVGASYFFYAQWNWHYCLLLAGSSVLTYSGGLAIGHASSQQTRKLIVGITVALHLLLLSTFKYLDFLVGSANHLLHFLGTDRELPFMEIILPVGISFFTFHGISYLVDVYRGDVAVCRRLVDILLYLSFFPQLVAGPIVTARQFVHEFLHPREADKVVISLGVNDGVSATTISQPATRARERARPHGGTGCCRRSMTTPAAQFARWRRATAIG